MRWSSPGRVRRQVHQHLLHAAQKAHGVDDAGQAGVADVDSILAVPPCRPPARRSNHNHPARGKANLQRFPRPPRAGGSRSSPNTRRSRARPNGSATPRAGSTCRSGSFGVQTRAGVGRAHAAKVHPQGLPQAFVVGGQAEVGLEPCVNSGVRVVIDGDPIGSWRGEGGEDALFRGHEGTFSVVAPAVPPLRLLAPSSSHAVGAGLPRRTRLRMTIRMIGADDRGEEAPQQAAVMEPEDGEDQASDNRPHDPDQHIHPEPVGAVRARQHAGDPANEGAEQQPHDEEKEQDNDTESHQVMHISTSFPSVPSSPARLVRRRTRWREKPPPRKRGVWAPYKSTTPGSHFVCSAKFR